MALISNIAGNLAYAFVRCAYIEVQSNLSVKTSIGLMSWDITKILELEERSAAYDHCVFWAVTYSQVVYIATIYH